MDINDEFFDIVGTDIVVVQRSIFDLRAFRRRRELWSAGVDYRLVDEVPAPTRIRKRRKKNER